MPLDQSTQMRCVYEAANGVEAHMIANMLAQYDIATRIDGEHLTSGVGELPAVGLVRVMTEETNYERARSIIREWEAQSPAPTETAAPRRSLGPIWFLCGIILSVGAMSWLYRPRLAPGVDFNNDGRLDERYIYIGSILSKVEVDANLDGKTDAIYTYDQRGLPVSGQVDTDFDGRFETQQTYERRLLKTSDSDWDGDGKVDRHETYANGVLRGVDLFAEDGYRVVKREYYEAGRLKHAEVDSNGDGIFDKDYRFDEFGQILEIVER